MKLKVAFPRLTVESDRMLHVDALRFLAAAGIVYHHTFDLPGLDRDALKMFVDLFFGVSGFVIADVYGRRLHTRAQYGRFIVARGAKLLPLHWLTLSVWLAFALVSPRLGMKALHADEFDLKCLAPNALLLHATFVCHHLSFNGPSWSISAEWFMYLAAPVILLLGRRIVLVTLIAIGVMSLLKFFPFVPEQLKLTPWFSWTAYGGVLRAIPSFCFGVFLFNIKESTRRIPAWVGLGALLLFAATSVIGFYSVGMIGLVYVVIAAAIGADQRGEAGIWTHRLAPLGRLTYSSYMIHTLVLLVFVSLGANRLLHATGFARVMIEIIAYVCVWPLSYLSLNFFEDPVRVRIRNAIYPRKSSPPLDGQDGRREPNHADGQRRGLT